MSISEFMNNAVERAKTDPSWLRGRLARTDRRFPEYPHDQWLGQIVRFTRFAEDFLKEFSPKLKRIAEIRNIIGVTQLQDRSEKAREKLAEITSEWKKVEDDLKRGTGRSFLAFSAAEEYLKTAEKFRSLNPAPREIYNFILSLAVDIAKGKDAFITFEEIAAKSEDILLRELLERLWYQTRHVQVRLTDDDMQFRMGVLSILSSDSIDRLRDRLTLRIEQKERIFGRHHQCESTSSQEVSVQYENSKRKYLLKRYVNRQKWSTEGGAANLIVTRDSSITELLLMLKFKSKQTYYITKMDRACESGRRVSQAEGASCRQGNSCLLSYANDANTSTWDASWLLLFLIVGAMLLHLFRRNRRF